MRRLKIGKLQEYKGYEIWRLHKGCYSVERPGGPGADNSRSMGITGSCINEMKVAIDRITEETDKLKKDLKDLDDMYAD